LGIYHPGIDEEKKMNDETIQNLLIEQDKKRDAQHQDVLDKIVNIDKTLISQQKDLEYHIKRTDLLEEKVTRIRQDTAPVHKHVDRVQFVAVWSIKLIGGSGVLTLASYLMKVLTAN